MAQPASIVFQSAKLGDIRYILDEFDWAARLQDEGVQAGRVYGISGGALVALAFGLTQAAQRDPQRWGKAGRALDDFACFLRQARSRDLRSLNRRPRYGFYNLHPLRRWLAAHLDEYFGSENVLASELGVPLYLCALDWNGVITLFGPPDDSLQFPYSFVRVGPPRDVPVLDATIAALSTMLSTEAVQIGTGHKDWYRDCRPAIVDGGAIVADLEAVDPRPILRRTPYAPIRPWKLNWFTSSFIMHSQNERNQTLLAAYYLDLQQRHKTLLEQMSSLTRELDVEPPQVPASRVGHVYLPYVGSTETVTNMRESAAHKDELMARFRQHLNGQLDGYAFEQTGGEVRQIYGVSAGVPNGFFHAVQVAAAQHSDLYRFAARTALRDLEEFMARVEPKKIARVNYNPLRLWQGLANLDPLQTFLIDRLTGYTGSRHAEQITFDDIALPLTVTTARRDGFTEFLGMTTADRRMRFAGREWRVRPAPIVRAILAGWSMNTYITPTRLGDQIYCDGGGTFYDPGLLIACLDLQLTNLLSVHLDEPDGHSYNLPPRPNLRRIIFDTHSYVFPEERRRMRALTDLLFAHYHLRAQYAILLARMSPDKVVQRSLPPDFRREWDVQ